MMDLCAAPGGKSCCAAELMQNKGRILAFDLYEARTGLILKQAERLGISIIEARCRDASVFMPEYESAAALARESGLPLSEIYDAIKKSVRP